MFTQDNQRIIRLIITSIGDFYTILGEGRGGLEKGGEGGRNRGWVVKERNIGGLRKERERERDR